MKNMIKFNAVSEDNPNINLEYPPTIKPIIVTIENEKLIGTFFKTAGKEISPIVFLLHGFPGNEVNYDIAHAIRRFGFNVVVFHYRGSWGSSGNFSISNSLEDVNSIIEYFSKPEIADEFNYDKEKIILIGHSMGGFISLIASMKYPNIKNVASLAGFNFGLFTDYILTHPEFKEITMEGLASGAELVTNSNAEKLFDEMVKNRENWNIAKRAIELKEKNILIIAAELDTVAPSELHNTPLVYSLKKADVSVNSQIMQCGHSFSSMRIKLTTEIVNWLESLTFN